jgi:hypothetical protein
MGSAEGGKAYWRDFIPSPDTARSQELAVSDTYQWAQARCAEAFVSDWKAGWDELLCKPYQGITTDGQVIGDLYRLAGSNDDFGAPVTAMMTAAEAALAAASTEERSAMTRSVDAIEWRCWINPEIYMHHHGVRLEETSQQVVEAVYILMRASLSAKGYAKARGCMKVNHFLGEVVNGRKVLNEGSYNFTIFGTPSESEPWGWQLHGHHLDMNCFVVGTQMVITPVFMGAEPNVIDAGPDKGTELFTDQEQAALKLIKSMDEATRDRVRIYKQLSGPEYPDGRHHRADQRHLGGAFQDNRVIPYEGVEVTTLSSTQQQIIRMIITLSMDYLPQKAMEAKIEEIERHWSETYFCWIGAFVREDGFYYKVHSPVVMIEFDHHSGVFLTNKDPLPFHIHTLVRTPNGNDYGKDLLRLHRGRIRQ